MTKREILQKCKVSLTSKNILLVHYINRTKNKNNIILSTDAEKAFYKI